MKYLLTFIFLTSACLADSQTTSYRKVHIYQWGLRAFDGNDSCATAIEQQYGFCYKTKAGCLVTESQVRRWRRHNAKVNILLNQRFGGEWKTIYLQEYAKCLPKK